MANDSGNTAEKKPKRNRVKETFSELKKVSWPTFGKVVKQTGAVFVVTIFFMLILMLMDYLLGLANTQLIKGLNDTASLIASPQMLAQGAKTLLSGVSGLPLLI